MTTPYSVRYLELVNNMKESPLFDFLLQLPVYECHTCGEFILQDINKDYQYDYFQERINSYSDYQLCENCKNVYCDYQCYYDFRNIKYCCHRKLYHDCKEKHEWCNKHEHYVEQCESSNVVEKPYIESENCCKCCCE